MAPAADDIPREDPAQDPRSEPTTSTGPVPTSTGSVRQRVQVRSDMARGTVALAIGWWEPEEPSLERALDYNCNNLTSDAALLGGEIQAFSCRGIPCRVEKFFGK